MLSLSGSEQTEFFHYTYCRHSPNVIISDTGGRRGTTKCATFVSRIRMEFDPLRTLIFGCMNLSRAERKFPNFFIVPSLPVNIRLFLYYAKGHSAATRKTRHYSSINNKTEKRDG